MFDGPIHHTEHAHLHSDNTLQFATTDVLDKVSEVEKASMPKTNLIHLDVSVERQLATNTQTQSSAYSYY